MLEPYQKKIIELFLRQELLLARLYKLFAANFPEFGDFWRQMAEEERQHGEWVKKFYQAEKKGLVAFNEGMVKTYTLKAFIEYAEGLLAKAERNEIGVRQAAVYTLDLEKSLIEKNVFGHFEILDEKVKGVMTRLDNETRKHIRKAEEFLRSLP